MTTAFKKKWAVATLWGIVCVVWIGAWLMFLFGTGRMKSDATVLLLVCGVVIGILTWRRRRDAGSEEH